MSKTRLFYKKITSLPHRVKFILITSGVIIFMYVWTTPSTSMLGTVKIYDKHSRLMFEQAGNTGRKQMVEYEQFPKHLIDAVVAAEDENFWHHNGIDLKAIARSMILNIQSGKIVSGASTITQQVARLNTSSQSSFLPVRIVYKIRQILMALRLSITYSKKDILSMYLNEVYLGNHNYGFQSAAQFYFHKNVDKLSLAESAYLAGMIASPARYDPYSQRIDGEKRKAYVLRRISANGYITKERRDAASATTLTFARPDTYIKAPHFVDYIIKELNQLDIPGRNISIYTTLDLDTYMLSLRIAGDWVDRLKDKHNVHNAAMIVIDNKTGAIISMLGGINYFDKEHDGQVNIITSPRQPGSAIKPITYTAAFLKGYTPATLIYDVKKSYTTKRGEGFIPNNFGDKYHGLVLAREALASSYNLPAVEMLHRVGLESFLKTAQALGISTFTNAHTYDYSITLGANEVTLLELANAYTTLAREGNYLETYAIENVTDNHNRIIYTHPKKSSERRLGEHGRQIAYLITDILADSQARMPGFGEKNYLSLSRPAAVKTGTTTDWHDVWTVGYTPLYTVGVWMGNNNNDAMRQISSATGAAPVWNQFFEEFLKGKPVEEFQRPDGIVEKEICALSGKLVDEICPERKREKFLAGTEPKETSNIHKIVEVDRRNNLLAGGCPPNVIEQKVFVDYPPEVYSWAVLNGKPAVPKEYSPFCIDKTQTTARTRLFITITNPKHKAVFQNAPLLIKRQGITLEANVSDAIKKVIWYIDGARFTETTSFPFSAILPLQSGNHIVYAEGIGLNDTVISDKVSFMVVDY